MRLETIKKLCCPFDKSDLTLQTLESEANGNVKKGLLICQECKRMYPIVAGIPIMSPDEYRDFDMERPLIESMMSQLGLADSKEQPMLSDPTTAD